MEIKTQTTLKPRISQADIARILGVDQTTVSCELRGKSNIGPDMRNKILEVCQKYNYRPNYFASSLRSSRSNLVGIITPALIDPYFANMIHFLGRELEKNGYHCSLRFSQDNKGEQRAQMLELLDNSAAGVILLGTHPELQHEVNKLLGHSVPVVAIGWSQPGTSSVASNCFDGGRQACRHLVSIGRKKLGLVAGGYEIVNPIVQGFQSEASDLGMPKPAELRGVTFSPKDTPFIVGHKYAQAFLDTWQDVDGVFCSSDTFALAMWSECRQRQIRVPEDLAIIGFDDIPFSAEIGLTTIRQSVEKMAAAGIEMLLDQIKKYPQYIAESRLMDCALVVRNSTVSDVTNVPDCRRELASVS